MNEKVLISGGSGLIGQRLSNLLTRKGYDVSVLSRHHSDGTAVKSYHWDPERNVADPEAFRHTDYIIHLAGSNIGEGRWTRDRKNLIFDSRILSGQLLFNECVRYGVKPKAFISASGVNYYGTVTSPRIFSETDPPGNDFLGRVCREWEQTASRFASAGTRSVVIRTGIALSMEGGVLTRMTKLASKGLAAALGSGNQYIPWIHLDDLCGIYLKAMADESMHGAYNAVAPEHVTNRNFMKAVSEVYHKPFVLPAAPALGLRLAYGEMASLVLEGSRVSAEKIIEAGFDFRFPELRKALHDLIKP